MSSQWFAMAEQSQRGGHLPTLLVVDDEQFIRTAFELYFETEGFQVLLAQNGEEALRTFEEHKGQIDVILLDLAMPGMHGLEVLRRLKASDPAVEIIIATGCGNLQAATEALALGAFDYVTKPIVSLDQDLLSIVRRALVSREARLLETQRSKSPEEPVSRSWARLALYDDLETLVRQALDQGWRDDSFQMLAAVLAQHFRADEIVAVEDSRQGDGRRLAAWSAAPVGSDHVLAWRLGFRARIAAGEPTPATLLVYGERDAASESGPPAAGLIALLLEHLFAREAVASPGAGR